MSKSEKFNPAVLLLLLIVLLSLSVRLYGLGVSDLELAEAYRFKEAETINSAFFVTLNYEEHPPLYSIFLHYWRFFGDTEFILRLSSVIFGVASVIVLFFMARQIFNYKVGLISSLILALNPLHISYSQTVEPYSFTIFFSFLAIYFLIKALGNNINAYWLGFILSILVAGYSDYFILLLLIALALVVVTSYKHYKTKIKQIIFWITTMAILFIPNIFIGLFQIGWVGETDALIGNLKNPLWYLLIIPYNLATLNVGMRSIFFNSSYFPIKEMLPVLAIILTFFLFFFLKGIFPLNKDKERKKFLLFCFSIPILLLYIASLNVFMFIDPHRFLFISFPMFIFIGKGISSLKNKKLFMGAIMVVLLIGSLLVFSNTQQEKTQISPLTSYIIENYLPGDVAVIMPHQYLPALWYYLPEKIHTTSFPTPLGMRTNKKYVRHDFSLEMVNNKTFPLYLDLQNKLSKEYNRMWLIIPQDRTGDDSSSKYSMFTNHISETYVLIDEKHSSDENTKLLLYEI